MKKGIFVLVMVVLISVFLIRGAGWAEENQSEIPKMGVWVVADEWSSFYIAIKTEFHPRHFSWAEHQGEAEYELVIYPRSGQYQGGGHSEIYWPKININGQDYYVGTRREEYRWVYALNYEIKRREAPTYNWDDPPYFPRGKQVASGKVAGLARQGNLFFSINEFYVNNHYWNSAEEGFSQMWRKFQEIVEDFVPPTNQ